MAKTAIFGLMHVATSFTVTYALTGSSTVAGIVTFVEPVINTVMHYFFDKYWEHPRAQAMREAVARRWARRIPSTRRTVHAGRGAVQAAEA